MEDFQENEVAAIKDKIRKLIVSENWNDLDSAINLIWASQKQEQFLDLFNELLITPNHRQHQVITMKIQKIGSPTSIPFIQKALESGFDYLEYTASESAAIAKWFSWALFEIGTQEAIDLMKKHTKSADEGIRNEMLYRLGKVN